MADETLTVRCGCGWEVTGPEAVVVPAVIEHGEKVHNMTATPEQVLATAHAGADGDDAAVGTNR